MKKRITMIALSAALLMAAGSALAQPPMMGGGGMRSGMPGGGMMLQNLLPLLRHGDLSDEQMERVREIMENARERIEAIRGVEDHEDTRERFFELFSGASITASQVEDVLNGRLEEIEEINGVIAEAVVELHGVLTPEQRASMADLASFEDDMSRGGQREHAPVPHGGRGGIHPRR